MPGGRRKSPKSTSPDREAPILSPQSGPSTEPLEPHGDFQQFVRGALQEIRRGQVDLNRRIDSIEANFNTAIEYQSKRVDELESKINELEKMATKWAQAEEQLAEHAEKLNKLERFSRRNNIRVIGFPQNKDEDCLDLCKQMLKDKFGLHDAKLERAHRDGPKTPGRPQHLLFKLNCYQDKVTILRQQRQVLADTPYFCTEDLTRQDLQEKRRWSLEVSKAYKEGHKYRFVAGKWRNNTGGLAAFYRV